MDFEIAPMKQFLLCGLIVNRSFAIFNLIIPTHDWRANGRNSESESLEIQRNNLKRKG